MTTPFIDAEREDKESASSWERVHYCPGSTALIKSIPVEQRDITPTEVAESGTRVHKAWETDSDDGLEMGEAEIKEQLKVLEISAANRWMNEVLIPAYGTTNGELCTQPVIREQRYWVYDNQTKITSAKVDVAYIYKNHALIIDGKTGYKKTTPAHRNLQCKVQAVALTYEVEDVTSVRVAVAAHRFSSTLTQGDYTLEDIERAYMEVMQDDWRSKQPDAQRVPGSHCTYCPAKAFCREAGTYALLPSRLAIPSATAFSKENAIDIVTRMTVEDVAVMERRRGVITKILEAGKSRLKKLPAEELAALGFTLDNGKAQSAVVDFSGLVNWLYDEKDDGVITDAQFNSLFEFVAGGFFEIAVPVIAMRDGVSQKETKASLRIELSKFINWEAERTSPSLKEKTTT